MTTLIETVLATCAGGILGFGFSWLTGKWIERAEQREHDRLMAFIAAEEDCRLYRLYLEEEWEE